MRKKRKILVLLIPAFTLYGGLFLFPAVQAIWVSLHQWSGFTTDMKFVGLRNFVEMTRDEFFWQTLGTTMKLVFIGGFSIFFLAFLFSYLLTAGIKGRKIFRAIIFYPNVIAPIALATFWGFLYNPRFGLLNGVLNALGLESFTRTWTGPDYIFGAVMVALVWTYVGFYMVVLLSGIEKIPTDYYDAAKIAGASRPQMFFKVTIPLIWDVLVVAVVFWIINAIKLFEFLFAFSGGLSAPKEIWTNAVYMFNLTFGKRVAIYRLGYGTAVAVILLLLVIVFTSIIRALMQRERIEY